MSDSSHPCVSPHDATALQEAEFRPPSPTAAAVTSRHSFRFETFTRGPTDDDRARDMGSRSLNVLNQTYDGDVYGDGDYLIKQAEYSVWKARYPGQPFYVKPKPFWDDAEDSIAERPDSSSPATDDESQAAETSPTLFDEDQESIEGTPTRRGESSMHSAGVRRLGSISVLLVRESVDKLNLGLVDLKLSSSEHSEERAEYLQLQAVICEEMQNPLTPLGKLKAEILRWKKLTEQVLQVAFAKYANIIASMLASASSCSGSRVCQNGSGIFRSRGKHTVKIDMQGYKVKPGIFIHGPDTDGDKDSRFSAICSFVEVKKNPVDDLRDRPLGQCFRYALSMVYRHASVGRAFFLTLCGPILRLWYTDATGFSCTTAYSFENVEDYAKIVDIIAFMTGPVELVLEKWQPKVGSTMSITPVQRGVVQANSKRCRVTRVEQLFASYNLWGSRTAVWEVGLDVLSRERLGIQNDMVAIVKSTWLPQYLRHHELDVLERLQEPEVPRTQGLPRPPILPEPKLPLALGLVNEVDDGRLDGQWLTTDGSARNSTIMTASPPGKLLDTRLISPAQHLQLFISLLRTLMFFARKGVHYRDFNEGNLLVWMGDGPLAALVIDFGNARVGKMARGDTYRLGSDIKEHPNFAEARSANDYYMSIRIHELSDKVGAYGKRLMIRDNARCKYQTARNEVKRNFFKGRLEFHSKILETMRQEIEQARFAHTYIDDIESALYLLLRQAYSHQVLLDGSQTSMEPTVTDQLSIMTINDLENKKRIWDSPDDTAMDCMPAYYEAICAVIEQVKSCQADLDKIPDIGSTQEYPDEGQVSERELICFAKCIAIFEEQLLEESVITEDPDERPMRGMYKKQKVTRD